MFTGSKPVYSGRLRTSQAKQLLSQNYKSNSILLNGGPGFRSRLHVCYLSSPYILQINQVYIQSQMLITNHYCQRLTNWDWEYFIYLETLNLKFLISPAVCEVNFQTFQISVLFVDRWDLLCRNNH